MNSKLMTALLIITTCFCGYAAEEQIALQSSDNQIFQVSKSLLSAYSKTFQHMFDDIKDDYNTPIPLPNINGDTLDIIIYCLKNIKKPDGESLIRTKLFDLNEEQLKAVTAAIRFLDIPKLYAKLPQVKCVESLTQYPIILPGHLGSVFSVAISPDNTFIVTGSYDRTARIWYPNGKQTILQGHEHPVTAVAISPDNRCIITGSWDQKAIIWDTKTGRSIRTLNEHPNTVTSVAFSPDNTFIVTGSGGVASIWHSNDKKAYLYATAIRSIAISPDNTFIVTGSGDARARIWNAKNGKLIRTLHHGHNRIGVTSVAISPDNTFIVTGSRDNTAIIWDAQSGKIIHTLTGHKSAVESVAISPDSRFIITGSRDNTAKIWDAKSGKPIRSLEWHKEPINSVAISSNNRFIVTGSSDKTAIIWPLYDPEQLDTLHPEIQDLIIRIYTTRDSGGLSLNTEQSAIYEQLPLNLQVIFRSYLK